WPVDSTYVLAMRSAALGIARPDPPGENFVAGHPIAYRLEQTSAATAAQLISPDDAAPRAISADSQVLRDAHTSRAGRYQLSWKDQMGSAQSHTLCASFDVSESNLQPLPEAELRRLLAPLSPTIVHWTSGNEPLTEHGRE